LLINTLIEDLFRVKIQLFTYIVDANVLNYGRLLIVKSFDSAQDDIVWN